MEVVRMIAYSKVKMFQMFQREVKPKKRESKVKWRKGEREREGMERRCSQTFTCIDCTEQQATDQRGGGGRQLKKPFGYTRMKKESNREKERGMNKNKKRLRKKDR